MQGFLYKNEKGKIMSKNIFISYCHTDDKYLNQLHKHLTLLKRDGTIDIWTDSLIKAGDKIGSTISNALEKSSIFIALLSPDYLNSDYCYEIEFKKAIELHEAGKMRILPIILEPCDWLNSPFKEFMALPKDGNPIAEWLNQNNAFLDITTKIREVLDFDNIGINKNISQKRSLKIKKNFDTIDKSNYADKAFDHIKNYFKESCTEINGINNIKTKFEDMDKAAFTCTVVNYPKEAHITVHNNKSERGFLGDITYNNQRYGNSNSSSGSVSIENDDYDLYLEMNNFGFGINHNDKKLTHEQVAEKMWEDFLERAGISYDG